MVTDGEPNDRAAATAEVIDLSRFPVFVKFLAIRPVHYLEELDDMEGRLVDNVDTKFISDPRAMSDFDFANAMVEEWSEWIVSAQNVGLLS